MFEQPGFVAAVGEKTGLAGGRGGILLQPVARLGAEGGFFWCVLKVHDDLDNLYMNQLVHKIARDRLGRVLGLDVLDVLADGRHRGELVLEEGVDEIDHPGLR